MTAGPRTFSLIAGALLLMLGAIAFAADPYVISVTPDKDAVIPGQAIAYNVSVKNTLSSNQEVLVIVGGAAASWYTGSTNTLQLGSEETKTFRFWITPPPGTSPRTYSLELTVRNKENSAVSANKTIFLYVQERERLEIYEVKTDKLTYEPGDVIWVSVRVANTGSKDADGYRVNTTVDGLGLSNATTIEKLKPERDVSITLGVRPDKNTAGGIYTGNVTVLSTDNFPVARRAYLFTVESRSVFRFSKDISDVVVFRRVTISATNYGNAAGVAMLEEPVSSLGWLYQFDEAPTSRDGKWTWTCDLKPLESCSRSFRINYWIIGVIVVIIGAASLFAFRQFAKPSIRKRAVHKKEGGWSIHVEVKNRSPHPLTDVEVLDHLPLAVRLIGEFPIEPQTMKRTRNGLTLAWKIGRLEPNEERVLRYHVKAALEVAGGITLPGAMIRARDDKGASYSRKSMSVRIG